MTGLDSSQILTDEASLHAKELHLDSHNKEVPESERRAEASTGTAAEQEPPAS